MELTAAGPHSLSAIYWHYVLLPFQEALEVLRTTPPIVELVVCRPGPELMGRVSPGGPPAPPLRQPPPDPLNLHAPRPRAPAPTPPPSSPPPANNVSDYEEPNPIYDVKYGVSDLIIFDFNLILYKDTQWRPQRQYHVTWPMYHDYLYLNNSYLLDISNKWCVNDLVFQFWIVRN